RDQHSIPTRRSSDLEGAGGGQVDAFVEEVADKGAAEVVRGERPAADGGLVFGGLADAFEQDLAERSAGHVGRPAVRGGAGPSALDRKSTRLNSSHVK